LEVIDFRLSALSAALIVAITGCIVQTGPAGGNLPANENPAEPPANQPNPPLQGELTMEQALDFIPSDIAVVGGADFRELRASSHYAANEAMLLRSLNHEVLGLLRDQCNLDVIQVAGMAIVAIPHDAEDKDRTIMILSSDVTWTELHECADRLAIEFEQDGDISVYRHPGGTLHLQWLSDNTFMVSANPGGRGLFDIANENRGLTNSFLGGLVAQVDTSAMVWFAIDSVKGRSIIGNASGMPGALGMFGSGNLPGSLEGRAGITFDTAQTARSTATQMAQQVDQLKQQPMVAPYVNSIRMSVEGNNVLIDVSLPERDVSTLISMLHMM
jgi:hypothetical protein